MRLINVETLQLCEIQKPDDDHLYAILSHTWEKDEVTFQEFTRETCRDDFSKEVFTKDARYSKIVRCCAEAELNGFKYVWVDTCCIDKTSSSELSEAINSMYRWYKEATVCYVYLSDVRWKDQTTLLDVRNKRLATARRKNIHWKQLAKLPPGLCGTLLDESRWFTRGWTLQELIAPRHVVFFDCNWVDIGTKFSLRQEIATITGIPHELLAGVPDFPVDSFCIAERMSWAANRRTTRAEDIAYSLMGIFDVNMPVLYGEGEKAFIRLQEEILKRSDDQSLLAWIDTPLVSKDMRSDSSTFQKHLLPASKLHIRLYASLSSVLAPSPDCFQYGQFIKRIEASGNQVSPFSATNKGLHIFLPLIRTNQTVNLLSVQEDKEIGDSKAFLAVLGCKIVDEESLLAITLVRQSSGRYIRIAAGYLCCVSHELGQNGSELLPLPDPTELYINTSISHSSQNRLESRTTTDVSVKVIIINCTVVECGNAYFGSYPNYTAVFALRIKSRGTGPGDTIVLLVQEHSHGRLSCFVYQPTGSAPFHQALREWWTKHKDRLQQNTSGSIWTDRLTLQLANGGNIMVSVNVGADAQFSVVIQWTDQQPTQPVTRPRHLVSRQQEQDPRAYIEMQRKYRTVRLGWTIFSREIHDLARDKKHHIGELN